MSLLLLCGFFLGFLLMTVTLRHAASQGHCSSCFLGPDTCGILKFPAAVCARPVTRFYLVSDFAFLLLAPVAHLDGSFASYAFGTGALLRVVVRSCLPMKQGPGCQ